MHEKWANLIVKLQKERHSDFSLNLLKKIQKNNKQRREKTYKLHICARWSILSRKLLQQENRLTMSPAFNLRRLAQKLLLIDKKKRAVNRWRRLGIKALKIVKQRQLGEGYIKDYG